MTASGSRCKDVRVGLTMAWVAFLQVSSYLMLLKWSLVHSCGLCFCFFLSLLCMMFLLCIGRGICLGHLGSAKESDRPQPMEAYLCVFRECICLMGITMWNSRVWGWKLSVCSLLAQMLMLRYFIFKYQITVARAFCRQFKVQGHVCGIQII